MHAMDSRVRRSAHGTAVIVAFCPFALQAAEEINDPIVVTATRQATRINELNSDVSVITREEIEQAGETSLAQLLARQPGIQYVANGGSGTNSNIFIRGTASNQSIVLIDGQRIGSATTGTAALSRIPLDQIDRIEILRGPASSLYGADALGGVIQVFTRRGEGPVRINASTGYGSYRTSDSTAGVSGGNELVSYSFQGGYLSTDSFNAINNKRNPFFNSDRDGYWNRNMSASVVVTPVKGQEFGATALVSNGTNRYDANDFGPLGANQNFNSDQTLANFTAYARNRIGQNWTSTLRFGRSIDDMNDYAGSQHNANFRTEMNLASWQNDIKLPVGEALLAAEYNRQKVSGTVDYTVSERTIRSLLAGWNATIGAHRVQANVRRDDNSQFGGENTGSFSYGYQFTPEWRAHAAYGTAFRAPTFNELYFPPSAFFSGGNPDLKPERAKNTEAGVNWERAGQRLGAMFYYNSISDLIEYRPPTFAPVNVSKALLRGATLTWDGRFPGWSAGVAVDFLDPQNEEDGPNKGKQLARRAKQQMSSYVTRTLGEWELRAEWQLVGKRYDDPANLDKLGGYGLVNLYADYRFQRDWTLFFRANNIFDKNYETANDYATAGTNVFVGVRFALK